MKWQRGDACPLSMSMIPASAVHFAVYIYYRVEAARVQGSPETIPSSRAQFVFLFILFDVYFAFCFLLFLSLLHSPSRGSRGKRRRARASRGVTVNIYIYI